MATRERRIDRARRLTRRALAAFGEDFREARLQAGLTQRELGAQVGISHTHVSRIERGLVSNVPYSTLVALGTVLGLDVPLRAYPSGDPVRDAGQLKVLQRLRVLLGPSLGLKPEVPVGGPGDLRAWDAVVTGPGWSMPVEAETRIRDVQALCRRLALKQRDGGRPALLLVLADTRHNREVCRRTASDLAALFPVPSRQARTALARGERPGGSAVLLV